LFSSLDVFSSKKSPLADTSHDWVINLNL
jgi:hypothetical protein